MNWLLDHLTYVIIIAFAFASWVKNRAEAKNAEAEERRARGEMVNDETIFEAEDDWQSPPNAPAPSVPPPLMRETTPPPLRVGAAEIDAILQHQRDIEDRLKHIREIRTTTSGNAAQTRARVAAAGKAENTARTGKTSLRDSLRDPHQTRRAIVLREILGPPVGLR